MKAGPLSEAYIATKHSGNEVLGTCPTKTEGRTHVNLHKNPQASLCACESVFWEDIHCKALAAMTSHSGNLTGPSCLYIEHFW